MKWIDELENRRTSARRMSIFRIACVAGIPVRMKIGLRELTN